MGSKTKDIHSVSDHDIKAAAVEDTSEAETQTNESDDEKGTTSKPEAAGAESDDEVIVRKRAADSRFSQCHEETEKKQRSDDVLTVFVMGLTFGVTVDEITKFFEECGEIAKVRFIVGNHAKCYVTFTTVEGAKAAVAKNNCDGPGGRYVQVYEHTFPSWYVPSAITCNADANVEENLRASASKFGQIREIKFFDKIALVVFESEEAADECVEGGKLDMGRFCSWPSLAINKSHYGLGAARSYGGDRRGGDRHYGGERRGGDRRNSDRHYGNDRTGGSRFR